ncbi:MAG: trypsin-like peptidase domain-containing protein [Ruminococcus sp.]|nr:trypsin-like peptidase domain-containing protein [Ruminococcus sp.]
MIKLKKFITLGVSSLTAMCLFSAVNANASYKCDVNNDGVTNVSDAVSIMQYLVGAYNIANPDVADFNNDGFVSEADATGIQYLGIGVQKPINADYTPSKKTQLNNFNVDYYRYNATTGKQIGNKYTVEAAPTIGSVSSQSQIGNDDRVKDYSQSAICLIETKNGACGTGFVASDNSILTAGHCLKNSGGIKSITFYDSNGNKKSFKPTLVDYSIPVNYMDNENSNFDYALITVSDDLSDYNNLKFGYALQYAIDTQATVYVTGCQGDKNLTMEVGVGRLDSTSNTARLYYTCDTSPGVSGAPIYADLIFEGKHYYTVVGIHTNGDPAEKPEDRKYNRGVRMCPNITNLIRNNLN